MLKKIIKNSFLVLLLALGFPVLLGILLSITVNNDAAFKQLANLFLKSNSIEITQVLNIDVSLTKLSLSFEKIAFKYQNNHARLEGLNIYLNGFNNKKSYHELTINKLSLALSNKEKDAKKNLSLDLREYLPNKIIEKYGGFDVWISELSLEHPYLKRPIFIKDIDLSNSANGLSLGLSSEVLTYQPELLFTLTKENKVTANIYFSKSDFVSLDLLANETKAEKLTAGIKIKTNLNLQLSTAFKDLLKQYFIHATDLDSLQSTVHLSGETLLPLQIFELEEIYPYLLASSLDTYIKSDLQFNKILMESIKIHLNFIGRNTLSDTKTSEDSEYKHSRSVQFLKHNLIKVKLNPHHEFFKNNQSAEFLADKELLLAITPNTQLLLAANTFTLGQGLSLHWAKPTDPAFLDWELNRLTGNYSPNKNFKAKLSYHLNGRWNRFFATSHDANIKLQSIDSLFKAETTIIDKTLQSQIDMSLEKNNATIHSQYHYQLGRLNSNSKDINKIISYWNKDLTLLSGSANLQGNLSAHLQDNKISNVIYNFDLAIKDIDLDYDDFIFSNINSSIKFSGKNSHITNNKPSLITIEKIDAGLLIRNIKLFALYNYYLDQESMINFSNLQAETLGGLLSSEAMTLFLPLAAEDQAQNYHTDVLVKLDNLQLSELLALAENPEIEGKGLLYGELPIYVDHLSTIIKAGWLKNKNPGTLHYRPNKASREMLKQNPQMKLLLDVLGHLNYQQLQADIELDDSGIIRVQGHTQGVNPDFKKDYPIIFNPSFELNIQDMIRSLQISDEIGSKVSDRVQEKTLTESAQTD